MMRVEVSYTERGAPTFHIFDKDEREIACHAEEAKTLVRLLEAALHGIKNR